MNQTPTTHQRPPGAHPGARPRIRVPGTLVATAAAALAVAELATWAPVLAVLSLNHNDAVVRSTSALGFITYNHNETMVTSAERA